MSYKLANSVLVILLGVLVVVVFFVRRDFKARNAELLPGMVEYVAYNSQSANRNFADGKTLQMPVEGTVARGFVPLRYKATPEDAKRAGEEMRSPLAGDKSGNLDRGAAVFATFCQPCHGSGGGGDGVIAQRGFPPPPSLLADNARKMKDGQAFHIITFGQRNMPSLASQVLREDRWRVIDYVRSLQSKTMHASKQ